MRLDLPSSECEVCHTPGICRRFGCELRGSSEDSDPYHTSQDVQRYAAKALGEHRRRLLGSVGLGAAVAVVVAAAYLAAWLAFP